MPQMNTRSVLRRRVGMLAGAIMLATSTVVDAGMQDDLQGFWATNAAPCNKVFTKKNGQVAFIRYRGDKAPGLIIKGDQIEGPQAACKILSEKEQTTGLVIVLNCKTQMILDKIILHVRFTTNDEFVQFDSDLPELTTTYNRCRM
jgi:hypothetical protein